MSGERDADCYCGHGLGQHYGRTEGCFDCNCPSADPTCYLVDPHRTKRGVERPAVYAVERDGVLKIGSTTGNRHMRLCTRWGWTLAHLARTDDFGDMLEIEADLLRLAAATFRPAPRARDWLPGGCGYTECFEGTFEGLVA